VSQALSAAVCQVFENMLAMEGKLSQEYEGAPKQFKADVSALIGLTGSNFAATVALHCNNALACLITGAMLGEAPKQQDDQEISDETRDAMGEFTNIVVGAFKTSLSEQVGEAVRMTVPTVIVGRNHSTRTLTAGDWSALAFAVQGQTLVAELTMARDKNGH
jgi:CheY-specific phosphatase CheX